MESTCKALVVNKLKKVVKGEDSGLIRELYRYLPKGTEINSLRDHLSYWLSFHPFNSHVAHKSSELLLHNLLCYIWQSAVQNVEKNQTSAHYRTLKNQDASSRNTHELHLEHTRFKCRHNAHYFQSFLQLLQVNFEGRTFNLATAALPCTNFSSVFAVFQLFDAKETEVVTSSLDRLQVNKYNKLFFLRFIQDLSGKPKGRTPLERPRRRWEDNI
jgi:hypothetical protein